MDSDGKILQFMESSGARAHGSFLCSFKQITEKSEGFGNWGEGCGFQFLIMFHNVSKNEMDSVDPKRQGFGSNNLLLIQDQGVFLCTVKDRNHLRRAL